ncbi:tRNA lysidine(34) synthetase TilS [Actinophytocola sp.]|uniref:tRNA lysidine(34) synthetase TilS n=1 Tax=Actinophytocola sp. TaxID=1872138 RepID=UPI0039C8A645
MPPGVTDFQPVARTRQAVRRLLSRCPVSDVAVAVSGGADSLALAAATSYVASRGNLTVHGLVVDHQLQPGSADVAAAAAKQLHGLGIDDVQVLTVTVTGRGGPEAAARNARYEALRSAGFPVVLLGHTLDDQAETVLLGLGRGSGPRSVAGMRDLDPPWARPFLSVPRATTVATCEALGLTVWDDPHNVDPAYTRVRLRREVLPLLEDVLQGGVAPALARTAAQLRDDTEALDTLSARLTEAALVDGELDVAVLSAEPSALRRRALRRWLLDAGVRELTDGHLRAADALIGEWRGQGAVWLPGNFAVGRARGRLRVTAWEPGEGSGCTATTSPPY